MSSYICSKCGTEVRGYDGCPGCKALDFQERMARAAERTANAAAPRSSFAAGFDAGYNGYSDNVQQQVVAGPMTSLDRILLKVFALGLLAVSLYAFKDLTIYTSGFMALVQLCAGFAGLWSLVALLT
jgi:predicted ATP-dependent serine protease